MVKQQMGDAADIVRAARSQGAAFGRSQSGAGHKVLVEFVSANPNGPLHVGHGRAAALGDVIARLLEWTGHQVAREFYVNDATNSAQMQQLGRSLWARYQQGLGRDVPLPGNGYEEEYVAEIAARVIEREGKRCRTLPERECIGLFADLALKEMLAQQREELARFGVTFDVWFSEQSLHDSGAVKDAIATLEARGHAYEAEGALWLHSSALGDERDRVLVRITGAPTYLAADAAYHRDKFARGFDTVIDIWGPEHQAYIARTHAAMAALGIAPTRLEILIHQNVRLLKGGETVRTSRRAGEVIPLSDLVGEVGADAARWFLLMRPASALVDLDMDLARKQAAENPLYCVQEAHVQMWALLQAAEAGGTPPGRDAEAGLASPDKESARVLARKVGEFPGEVERAAGLRQPERITAYANELADAFRAFCADCRVSDGPAPGQAAMAHLALVDAARIALGNALRILGISAPPH